MLKFTTHTDGESVKNARYWLDNKIRESRKLLSKRKSSMSPSDYREAREVISAQRRLYESVFGIKW